MGYVGNEPSVNFTSFAKQDITGDGGASYTLTHAVANANEIEVFVNNVRQEPTSAYSVSGTALTMTGNVASTDDFYVIYLGKALQTTVPPDGSVTSAKISYPLTTFSSTGIDDNATSTAITIDSSDNVAIGSSNPQGFPLQVNSGVAGNIARFTDGVNANTVIKTSGSVTTFGPDTSNNLAFQTNGSERGRFGSGGSFFVNTTSTSPNPGVALLEGGRIGIGNSNGNSGNSFIEFRRNATQIGSVTQSGTTAVSYNTSSDHRLKENVTADWDATTRIKQLNPVRFNFIADADTTVDGFLAHEVQSVVPEAITGTHNEVDDDGNPVYQGIDQSKLVPLLVKTIQELEARITALENS